MRLFAVLFVVACGGGTQPAAAPNAPAAKAPVAPVAAAPAAPAAAAPGAAAPTYDASWSSYGGEFKPAPVTPVAKVLDNPASFVNQPVVVEGKVSDVCQKKGCWMVVSDGTRTLRVTMKDHDKGVDMGAAGQLAHVAGVIVEKAVDPKTVEHFRSESANKNLPEDAAQGGKTYEVVADAVRLKKS